MTAQVPHILVVGGGYVGMYTAYGLRRAARKGKIRVTVVDPRSVMTYQPFLPEAAAGSVEPRHVVVPLRKTLKGCRVVTGRVTGIDHADKVAKVMPEEGPEYELAYDQVVVALGSIARTLPIPGLAEEATGFKNVEEAIALRNKVLDRLDVASSQPDPALRKSALTFVFVGGGYAGVEAFAELEDMARYATRYYDNIEPGRHALGAGRGDRPDPAGGRRGARQVHRRPAAQAQHGHQAGDPAGVLREGPRDPQRRRRVRRRHDRLDRRREGEPGARGDRLPAGRARAGSSAWRPADRGCHRRLVGRRQRRRTGPDQREARRVLRPERAARGAPGAAGWPRTSCGSSTARRRRTTSTSTSARSRASACTRASPSCTA